MQNFSAVPLIGPSGARRLVRDTILCVGLLKGFP